MTILLFHIISARPSKQPLMVRTFLKVYVELGSLFLFLQEQIKVTSSRRAYGIGIQKGLSQGTRTFLEHVKLRMMTRGFGRVPVVNQALLHRSVSTRAKP